jgi:hypothetical protein
MAGLHCGTTGMIGQVAGFDVTPAGTVGLHWGNFDLALYDRMLADL